MIRSNRLQAYDYESSELNIEHYGMVSFSFIHLLPLETYFFSELTKLVDSWSLDLSKNYLGPRGRRGHWVVGLSEAVQKVLELTAASA